mgnify:CR=1 FL=1
MNADEKLKKVTRDLARKARSSSSRKDVLEVIVELNQPSPAGRNNDNSSSSRSSQIAERKESFARISTPVENAISRAGGIVTDRAWINRTLKARVPVGSLKQICELEEVERLDTPHDLDPDISQ